MPGAFFLRVSNLSLFFETLFREEQTAAGGPSFDRYSNNPIFELELPSLAQVKYVVTNSYYYYYHDD